MPRPISGHSVQTYQRGRRLYTIGLTHRIRRWKARSLLSSALRPAIFHLSSGLDLDAVTTQAVNYILSHAKSEGLDTPDGTDNYSLAQDLCSTAKNIFEYLSRCPLLTLKLIPDKPLFDTSWSFSSYQDESGLLHRWAFVPSINDDEIMKEVHSWTVMGDMTLARSPLSLHLISIGQTSGNHRTSPWCRAYRSSSVPVIKFQKKSGQPLTGDWKPYYFADNISKDERKKSSDWVDLMMDDNAIESIPLIRHLSLKEPSNHYIKSFYRDLKEEYGGMQELEGQDASTIPMCRSACESPYPCPHQLFCYSSNPNITLDGAGIYAKILPNNMAPSTPSPSTPSTPSTSLPRLSELAFSKGQK